MAALVCPEKDEAEKRVKVLHKLKDLIEKAEQDLAIGVRQIPCGRAPLLEPTKPPEKPAGPPDVMVCYKLPRKNGDNDGEEERDDIPLSMSKSRELRAGVLYRGCHCCKNNGLQDDCPRAECQGSPACLTKPITCGPVAYCDARHLTAKSERYRNKDKEKTKEQKMKYKCFPATVKQPEMPTCITTCIYEMA